MSNLPAVAYVEMITAALNDSNLALAQHIWAEMHEKWPADAEQIAALARTAGQRGLDKRAAAERQLPSSK